MGKHNGKSSKISLSRYIDPFRVDGSREFHLNSYKADEKGDLNKDGAHEIIDANRELMR